LSNVGHLPLGLAAKHVPGHPAPSTLAALLANDVAALLANDVVAAAGSKLARIEAVVARTLGEQPSG
jgi:hypothetical protein